MFSTVPDRAERLKLIDASILDIEADYLRKLANLVGSSRSVDSLELPPPPTKPAVARSLGPVSKTEVLINTPQGYNEAAATLTIGIWQVRNIKRQVLPGAQ